MRGRPRQRYCARGHDLDDPRNILHRADGKRSCKVCRNERRRTGPRHVGTLCANGLHDLTVPGAIYVYRGKSCCLGCRRQRALESHRRRKLRRAQGLPTTTDALTPAEAERQLEAAVRLECAPPWERHPVPWD